MLCPTPRIPRFSPDVYVAWRQSRRRATFWMFVKSRAEPEATADAARRPFFSDVNVARRQIRLLAAPQAL